MGNDKELKPCPFCGEIPKTEPGDTEEFSYVWCEKCISEEGTVNIDKWNRRA